MPLPDLAKAVRGMPAPTLLEFGLAIADAGDTFVTLLGDRRAIRLSYNREDLPHAWLAVTVGASEAAGDAPRFVALWRAFPDQPELQDADAMEFGSQAELEERVIHVRDDWYPRFIVPLLESEEQLQAALMDQEQAVLLEYESRIREQHLREARSRFDRADYRGVIDAYAMAGTDSLAAGDARRLAIARRNLEGGPST